MKTKIINFLSKPKKIIPVFAVLAVALIVFGYRYVGIVPSTDVALNDTSIASNVSSGTSVDLAFSKAGRIESVSFKKGDTVKKGDIIAKLSAPDAEGLVSQAKSALALAQAQYALLDLNYANTKKQQDILVDNAYQILLKTTPEAVAKDEIGDSSTTNYSAPIISGNYLLGKEGAITIKTYKASGGFAFNTTGLVTTTNIITSNPIPIGNSGLSILFPSKLDEGLTWTINLPNTKSVNYAANKNAYDLAVANREKALSELSANLGTNSSASVAKAQVDAARGAYDAALGAYQNNLIISPVSGIVTFVDENLKSGQSASSGKTVINITAE